MNTGLERELRDFMGERIPTFDQCYRCGACSGICPVKKTTLVFDPRKIIHLLLLGLEDRLFSEVLWYCSQCGSCVEVCPMDVKPKDVIFQVRNFMLRKGLIDWENLFGIGVFARVDAKKCIVCLTCVRTCPFGAVAIDEAIGVAKIDPQVCKACGICVMECPARAIELPRKPEYLEVRF